MIDTGNVQLLVHFITILGLYASKEHVLKEVLVRANPKRVFLANDGMIVRALILTMYFNSSIDLWMEYENQNGLVDMVGTN